MSYQPWTMGENFLNEDEQQKQNTFYASVESSYCKEKKNTSDINETIKSLKVKLKKIMKDQALFVLIDEAKGLLKSSDVDNKEENKESKLQVLRRSIIKMFTNAKIVFLLTDINSKISNFNPAKNTIGSRFYLNKPFYETFSTDLLLPEEYKNKVKNVETFNYRDLLTRDPFKTLFYYGRPLWGSLLENNYPTILELAQEKLICSSDWFLVKDADKTFAT